MLLSSRVVCQLPSGADTRLPSSAIGWDWATQRLLTVVTATWRRTVRVDVCRISGAATCLILQGNEYGRRRCIL
jgi:hypothetical protein